jgi:guanylate kinase
MRPGPLIIVSGPSAVGKSTLVERLIAEKSWPLRLSVSATTRPRRPHEIDGVQYHFWTRAQFESERDRGAFLEWAEVYGNYYGTPEREVTPYRNRGEGVLLDIDTQGCAQVKRQCPDAVAIFIRTSSPAEYERRLRARGTESEEQIGRRIRSAANELAQATNYDFQVVNDDLQAALAALRAIIKPLFDERNLDAG